MIYTSPFPSPQAGFAALPQLVRRAAERSPDHPAIVDAPGQAAVSYGTLARQIGQVAATLIRRGFGPGQVLALRAPNTPAAPASRVRCGSAARR